MTVRFLVAMFLVVAGAILASSAASTLAEILFMSVMGLAAIAVVALHNPRETRPDLAQLDRERKQILFQGRSAAYQDIIDPITDPILLIRNAKVAAANPAAEAVLGNHIVGEDVRIAIRHPAAADRLANPNAKHSGEPILLVGVGNAEQRWELRIHGLNDGLKLVQLSDQSSRYAAERMRTDFVANASHELRTPLAAIKGFLETLEDPAAGKDDDTRARFLKVMYDEADRMQRLVEDLMSLSRIEAEKFQLPEEPLDLENLIMDVRRFYLESRGRKDADFKLSLPDEMPKIRGDLSQLSQLLHNLVSNAYKYGHKAKPVTVKVEPNRSGSMLRLSVTDQGDGIAVDHIPRLTERFYRVDKGRSKAIGGTGLGLAIVKHITQRHGGRMEITSELGVGTTVSVYLPVMKESATADESGKAAGEAVTNL
ncbi:two-component system, OmpR family, phosphate regulon sensor histidine kinase PhoR [Parasphingorhabdus marina DSM 22363]|uniref:histidine kinase n=1 Tax=Parasphingorhabdus marina DSM 22363 TaxID=1123272 RepID=A0A1N6F3X8_9SPHN|nr:ATP-binding protein [Parasphingorhabdus marina]SIN89980.1 two-component system, OmpR family, phosphate regulon sensor histidine kinase PhoR [Parasphingorhabdus marina DSM 22363]